MKDLDFSKDRLTIAEDADEVSFCGDANPSLYISKTKGGALTISFETDNSIPKQDSELSIHQPNVRL